MIKLLIKLIHKTKKAELTKDQFLSSIKDKDETTSEDPVDILKAKIDTEIESIKIIIGQILFIFL